MRSTLEKSYRSAEAVVGSLEQQRKDFQQQVARNALHATNLECHRFCRL